MVTAVPPLATDSVPEMLDRVVVAIQAGMPFERPRTKPFVEAPSFDREFVPPAYKMSPVEYVVWFVPPLASDRAVAKVRAPFVLMARDV